MLLLHSVLSGFWNDLTAHLKRSLLNHSYGYAFASDRSTLLASSPHKICGSKSNSRRLARRAEGWMPGVIQCLLDEDPYKSLDSRIRGNDVVVGISAAEGKGVGVNRLMSSRVSQRCWRRGILRFLTLAMLGS